MAESAPPPSRSSTRLPLVILVAALGVVLVGGVVVLVVVRSQPSAQNTQEPVVAMEQADVPPVSQDASAIQTQPTGPAYDLRTRADGPPLDDQEAYVAWMLANTPQQESYLRAKWARAQVAIRWGELTNQRVREAFLRAPREEFARTRNLDVVYNHMVLDIGYGQTISGPHLVAKMTDYLNPEPEHKVLEIGTGSGYQSAVLAELSNHVYTIEIVPQLASQTDQIYKSLYERYPQYRNITRKEDDGYYGWSEHAPFDRIVVTCGIDHIPPELLKQLKVGGSMVIPVGPPSGQTILMVTKTLDAEGNVVLEREDLYGGRLKEVFVPFTARGGGVHSQARDQTGAATP